MTEEIKLTVCLPLWNAKDIAWLALESLCNQVDVPCKWELLVYEECIGEYFGYDSILEYEERLSTAGCARVVYQSELTKVPLLDKWIELFALRSETSKAILLQAGDCYSFSRRLAVTYWAIVTERFTWYDVAKGMFYDVHTGHMAEYRGGNQYPTNLSMAFHADLCDKIKPDPKRIKGIDGHIFRCLGGYDYLRIFRDMKLYPDHLDTHGLNNISKWRGSRMKLANPPFAKTKTKLEQMNLPDNVITRLKALKQ